MYILWCVRFRVFGSCAWIRFVCFPYASLNCTIIVRLALWVWVMNWERLEREYLLPTSYFLDIWQWIFLMYFGVFHFELPWYFAGHLMVSVINIFQKSCGGEYFQYCIGRLIAIIAVLLIFFLSIVEFFLDKSQWMK